jgi:hypothetical protein
VTPLDTLQSGFFGWLRDWPNLAVPLLAADVYTVWDGDRHVCSGIPRNLVTSDELSTFGDAAQSCSVLQEL